MKKLILVIVITAMAASMHAQELYPYTEPASNMPTNSVSARFTANFRTSNSLKQKYLPEIMFGLSRKLMVHLGNSFSDMHTSAVKWEGVYTYVKYRFLSFDEVHQHFRMAAFVEGGYSRNPVDYEELNFTGDMSGVQTGIIATQLINKVAVSASASFLKTIDEPNELALNSFSDKAINYSFSAGLLVLPFRYKDYNQTNLNIYTEVLGQKLIGDNKYYIDFAPSIQFIFKSTAKLNVGYRFQLDGNELRNTDRSIMASFEYIFLNALRKK
ncbi:MAG: hypothetical protein ICV66_11215 [Chitinophagaceae bacterium]|nr:hypothetical protein [Chitinophagaceae bacterium]